MERALGRVAWEEPSRATSAYLDSGLDLSATGRHPELGRVTAGELLATWVVHDLGHLRQIARVMAHQYRDAVGPWRPYVPVLAESEGR